MKTLHLLIIIGTGITISILAGIFVIMMSSQQPWQASEVIHSPEGSVEISDITTEPKVVVTGESFQIYATIRNNNHYPVSFGTGCGSSGSLSASFDKNIAVNQTVYPCPFSPRETLESGQEMKIHGPSIGTIYNATSVVETNATVTFYYELNGNAYNVTAHSQFTVYPQLTHPSVGPSHDQLNLGTLKINSTGTDEISTSKTIPQIADNNPLWKYLLSGKISSIKISNDDSYIVAGTNMEDNRGNVYLFDNQGSLLWQKTLDRRIGDVSISPDGSYISASGFQLSSGPGQFYENGEIYFFDKKGNQLWNYNTQGNDAISYAPFSSNDSVVVAINDTVINFDKQGKTLWKYDTNDYLRNVSTSQDGSFVVAYSSTKIFFLNSQGMLLWTFTTDDKNIDRVIISHDGRYVVVGDAIGGYEGNIYLLDTTGNLLWKNHVGGPLSSVSMSGNSSYIAATNNWQTYLFNLQGTQLWRDNIPSQVTISSDGSFIVGVTYSSGTNKITFFDRQGNIASSYPLSGDYMPFVLSQDDKYFVIANEQDKNQIYLFKFEPSVSYQTVVNLTSMQTSSAPHMEIIPQDGNSFDVTVEQGQTIQLPWDIKLDDNYTTVNLQMSIKSPSNMESSITPVDPYSTINGIPPGQRMIIIHPSSNTSPGNYTVRIMGQGNTVHQSTGWLTDLDNKTLAAIHVFVKPHNSQISVNVGSTYYEMRSFCVHLEPSGDFCSSGPIYEEIPITVYSNHAQTIKLDALNIQQGEWVKFNPEQIVAGPNGTISKMIVAGYEVPVLRNPLSDKSLIIRAASEHDSTTAILPVIQGEISVLHMPSPIKLGKITTNSNGVNFGLSGVVYDPLDNSNGTLPTKLSVLGIMNGNNISSLPPWLSVDIPNPSFTLNSTQPYDFMTIVKTNNAPNYGVYTIAMDENIGGKHFIQPEEITIENVHY